MLPCTCSEYGYSHAHIILKASGVNCCLLAHAHHVLQVMPHLQVTSVVICPSFALPLSHAASVAYADITPRRCLTEYRLDGASQYRIRVVQEDGMPGEDLPGYIAVYSLAQLMPMVQLEYASQIVFSRVQGRQRFHSNIVYSPESQLAKTLHDLQTSTHCGTVLLGVCTIKAMEVSHSCRRLLLAVYQYVPCSSRLFE